MTMDVKHLDRAKAIVEGIKWCRDALSYVEVIPSATMAMSVQKPHRGSSQPVTQNFLLSKGIREKAFILWRREVELKEAALRREAAQIGLKLEDSADV
ncbi:hypothetical protein F1640_18520 [Novosphingobium sp. NBM11]|uniref:hypothetical protein n=1 Tax=Novosphingobium sp. NBM11 TaxID=2596914 RepID=UPI0018925445|nr:hypothetical protein [Novosphingobium sp. NBM11]MBF5091951.1 hypothetical protein [Novosphingobium sp. NBM11]